MIFREKQEYIYLHKTNKKSLYTRGKERQLWKIFGFSNPSRSFLKKIEDRQTGVGRGCGKERKKVRPFDISKTKKIARAKIHSENTFETNFTNEVGNREIIDSVQDST